MRWPFGKKNRELRARELDCMSEMKCKRMGASRTDTLHVTLEDDQFTIRQDGGDVITRYQTAAKCERYLRGYYRELFFRTSVWSE